MGIDSFYQDYRWKNWIQDSQNIKGDQAFSVFPYLWTVEGKDIENSSKRAINVKEIWGLHLEIRKQLEENS